jgi:acetylornithine deacetylase/succinyl-diaminopimelate desuccinylase-like protein
MVLEKQIMSQIDLMKEEIIELTRALIRIPVKNSPGEYDEISKFLTEKPRELASTIECEIKEVPSDYLKKLGTTSPRPNVLGVWRGYKRQPSLVFTAPMDVTPPVPNWTKDPFAATIEGEKIYGNAAGCKAGIAAALMAVKALNEAGIQLTGDVKFAWTADGQAGDQAGLKYLLEHGLLQANFVILPAYACTCAYTAEKKIQKSVKGHTKRVTGSEAQIRERPGSQDVCVLVDKFKTPALLYGPTRLQEGRAHGPDEFVEIKDLINVTKVYALVTMDLLGVSAWKNIDELYI